MDMLKVHSFGFIILKKHIGPRKVGAKWIHHLWTEKLKRLWVEICRKLLKILKKGNLRRLSEIVTDDET